MTRVLHVIDSLDPRMGGTARAALEVCAGLVERGQDVVLASTVDGGEEPAGLLGGHSEVPVRLFARRAPRHNFRSPSLRRWLSANVARFELVEIHGVFSFVPLYASRACARSGTPYTVRPHGSLDPFDLRKHAAAKKLLAPLLFRPMLQGAAAVVLTSQREADHLVTFGASIRPVVVPLPVSPPGEGGDGPRFRRTQGIPEDALVVLLLGRIHEKKGLQFLIPSLAALKPSFDRLWFVVVGSGENRFVKDVDDLVSHHGMASWTTRCPFLSGHDKQSAFAASDVFALPSLNENFGIAVVEAMYAGLPVIVSSEVYINEVVVAGGAGIVCEPTTASCRSALAELLSDDGRRRQMARRGPGVARRNFGPDPALGRLVDTYDELARLGRATLSDRQ